MSGYLEVKYPFKSNIGLNPFKSWKRQWCILRPGPSVGGGSLAVYCSEAGASAGSVELRSGCVVKRAKSRSRPHAFAVFSVEEPCKPRILLAAQTLQEAQQWMDKIRELLNGQKLLGTETLLKDSYSVTIVPTELSQLCGMVGVVTLTLSSSGLLLARPPTNALLRWQNITNVLQERENGDRNKTCILSIDSGFHGGGEMKLSTALSSDLTSAVKLALKERVRVEGAGAVRTRSQPDLSAGCPLTAGELRRSSWYSGPSEVSFDDSDLTKEAQRIPCGQLSRSSGRILHASLTSLDDSMCDRRSLVSVASGVYEEISEEPRPRVLEEPTYESVADCIYATMRRTGKRHPPPPLPPRHPYHTMKLGESWSCRMEGAADAGVTRHSSLGSLHHKPTRPAKPFSVFRKRLKSDSRIATSPKSDASKDNKDVETKKKKFDFTPTRDIFKSFKVSRKMKSLKLNSGLSKGETKSCEFLDETQHVTTNRCSKSVECLEGNDGFDEFDGNISLEVTEEPSVDFVPQELFQLILCPDLSKVRLKDPPCLCESEYMPMSPIVPPPMEQHYMVMSPRTNQA